MPGRSFILNHAARLLHAGRRGYTYRPYL